MKFQKVAIERLRDIVRFYDKRQPTELNAFVISKKLALVVVEK